jgi:hypothetical protein
VTLLKMMPIAKHGKREWGVKDAQEDLLNLGKNLGTRSQLEIMSAHG